MDQPSPEHLALFKDYPLALASIFYNRNIKTKEEAEVYLKPDFARDTHDPFLFKNMNVAVDRIFKALKNSENIVIYGDYDADGVTGSAVILSTLKHLVQAGGYEEHLSYYIPHRENEGYGLRVEAVEQLARDGANLIITVDCGIGCAVEIARAKELGIDAIVVDHHEIPANIPEAIILHPRVEGETYPFKYLAAVGVSFKLACGLYARAREMGLAIDVGAEKWLLDLVSIATVTDVVPLVGENRTLEKWGLVVLKKSRRHGLKMILEQAGVKTERIDTTTIGFVIGPRLNAASRMEHGKLALEALLTENVESAMAAVAKLNELNQARQKVTETIYRQAKIMLEEKWSISPVHIVAGADWSAGIVGLIAGKLMNESGRPTFVFGRIGDRYVGSGRSIPGCNVVTGMELARAHLFRFGGHAQACGLTIDGEENFLAFAKIMEDYVATTLASSDLGPTLDITAKLRPVDLNWNLVNLVESCAPFGEGNPKPYFVLACVELRQKNLVGKTGDHVRAYLGDGALSHWCIGFGMKDEFEKFAIGAKLDVVVELGSDLWNGERKISIKMVDLRAAT